MISPRIATLDVSAWQCESNSVSFGYFVELEGFITDWVDKKDLRAVESPTGRVFYDQPALAGCSFAITRDLYASLGGFDTGMLSYGLEDLEFGLRAWLMGHSILLDPVPMVGHRFLEGREKCYRVPPEHYLLNKLRAARRNFGLPAWADWLASNTAKSNRRDWGAGAGFVRGKSRAARHRARSLHARRCRDEFQYAAEFGLAWPLTLPSSPLAPPSHPRYPDVVVWQDNLSPDGIPTTIPMTKKVPDVEPDDQPTTIPMTKKVPDDTDQPTTIPMTKKVPDNAYEGAVR